MKKPVKRPSFRPAAKPTPKPAPSLVDVKTLAGQMKGMLTWMSKERAELQHMIAQVQAMIASLTPPSPDAPPAEAPAPDDVPHEEHYEPASCEDSPHGDPVVSGAVESE